jgi:hypothetical protein
MIPAARLGNLIMAIQNRFLDTPGLELTPWAIEEEWRIDDVTRRALVNVLLDARVLKRTGRGHYTQYVPPVSRRLAA